MKVRILAAAGGAFSRAGYDAVGVREIATLADTDAAIVIRLFGSKAELFTTLADSAFGAEDVFDGPLGTLGVRLASHLMSPMDASDDAGEANDFLLLLRSATSLTAAPILSAALHRALIGPLGQRIGSPDGAARASLVTAQVLGFSTLRFALGSPPIEDADRRMMTERLAALIQNCVDA
jgi:AcrR family transcriptional regulator